MVHYYISLMINSGIPNKVTRFCAPRCRSFQAAGMSSRIQHIFTVAYYSTNPLEKARTFSSFLSSIFLNVKFSTEYCSNFLLFGQKNPPLRFVTKYSVKQPLSAFCRTVHKFSENLRVFHQSASFLILGFSFWPGCLTLYFFALSRIQPLASFYFLC